MRPWQYRLRDRIREYIGANRTARLLTLLIERMTSMIASQQDIVDALQAEDADLQTLAANLKNFLSDVDALIAAGVSGPNAQKILDGIAAHRATIGKFIADVATEDTAVRPPTPTLTVSPTSVTVNVGDTAPQIVATPSDGAAVTFASADESIAVVTGSGSITGLAAGTTTVTATAATGATASVSITVIAPATAPIPDAPVVTG